MFLHRNLNRRNVDTFQIKRSHYNILGALRFRIWRLCFAGAFSDRTDLRREADWRSHWHSFCHHFHCSPYFESNRRLLDFEMEWEIYWAADIWWLQHSCRHVFLDSGTLPTSRRDQAVHQGLKTLPLRFVISRKSSERLTGYLHAELSSLNL